MGSISMQILTINLFIFIEIKLFNSLMPIGMKLNLE